jgi:polygalacturonase
MLVTNCTFNGTTSGIRIKTSREKGGTIEGLVYRDITMTNVTIPINITCYYPKIPATDTAQPVTATTPVYRNIRIENLTAYGPKGAGFIVGLPEKAISDITLENVHLFAHTGLVVRNATGIHFKNSSIKVDTKPALISDNAQVDGWQETNDQ